MRTFAFVAAIAVVSNPTMGIDLETAASPAAAANGSVDGEQLDWGSMMNMVANSGVLEKVGSMAKNAASSAFESVVDDATEAFSGKKKQKAAAKQEEQKQQ